MPIHFDLSQAMFQAEYLEKNYLLLRNVLRHAPFSMEDLDRLVHVTEPTAPFLRLHNGGFVPEESYVEIYNDLGTQRRRIIKPAFYSHLKEGATLILNRVDARHELIRSLCLDVAKFTGQHTLANGYLAFGRQASFGKHWDCHDVFAVQLHGRKRWQLYRPTFELPLPNQTSKDHKAECPAEPVLDTILETGDILYIPRGWWHCATPVGEETFHVAIGVHPPYIADYFGWLCSTKLGNFLSCRRSLSLDGGNDGYLRAAMEDVQQVLASGAYLDEYLTLIAASDRVPSPFRLSDVMAGPGGVADDAVVRLNTIYPRQPQRGACVVNGQLVRFTEEEAQLLALLEGHAGRTVAQLRAQLAQVDVAAVLQGLIARDIVQLKSAGG